MKSTGLLSFVVALVCSALIGGCSTQPKVMASSTSDPSEKPRKLAVFFDGTANDESSDTNIRKLHSLVTLQDRPDIGTFYIEGVGANGKVVGMATGWGTRYRVKHAYRYLAKHYVRAAEDKIYLFGFSRGAYSARILASMLYHAGLPDHVLGDAELDAMTDAVYDAFTGIKTSAERKTAVKTALQAGNFPALKPAKVAFMGLWDTVEALGIPDYEENFQDPNLFYGDQLCNVEKASHALALDDDRARIFTPILLTRGNLLVECGEGNAVEKASTANDKKVQLTDEMKARLNNTVNEVWFSGAHADVGGGYPNTLLSGVSLNWMISEVRMVAADLLPENSSVRSDPREPVHDPEAGLLWGTLYKRQLRSLDKYIACSPYKNGHLTVHDAVIERLREPERLAPDQPPRDAQWSLPRLFENCFRRNSRGGYDYIEGEKNGCMVDHVGNSTSAGGK